MDDADVTLRSLRAVNKSLKQGNLRTALSQMEKIDPSCGICDEYLSDGKVLVGEIIDNCQVSATGDNEECKALKEEVIELVSMLEEAYVPES